ncbi:hypothetical protein [Clostridium sp. ZS2-4]|uniref:hypothetical protein n=1 Tax=Clostridium sp. ZS2-4 TaxID=2987703 RepID=UPI00227A92D7|nr:hypothetical protein [Clostridium sp. ZS2-4]MCY6355308.1 hypothetical protein [Clostridium sp. ZS2-4]
MKKLISSLLLALSITLLPTSVIPAFASVRSKTESSFGVWVQGSIGFIPVSMNTKVFTSYEMEYRNVARVSQIVVYGSMLKPYSFTVEVFPEYSALYDSGKLVGSCSSGNFKNITFFPKEGYAECDGAWYPNKLVDYGLSTSKSVGRTRAVAVNNGQFLKCTATDIY